MTNRDNIITEVGVYQKLILDWIERMSHNSATKEDIIGLGNVYKSLEDLANLTDHIWTTLPNLQRLKQTEKYIRTQIKIQREIKGEFIYPLRDRFEKYPHIYRTMERQSREFVESMSNPQSER